MIVIFLSVLISFWTIYLLANVLKAADAPSVTPSQSLVLGKSKPRRKYQEGQEAQLMPWAHKLEDVTITYYDCCVACCGKDDGLTYSGTLAVPYETCAVDPDVIPLGASVSVDYGDGELHHLRAEDTGCGVKGNHIDICVASHEEALELGRKTATVYWMEDKTEVVVIGTIYDAPPEETRYVPLSMWGCL